MTIGELAKRCALQQDTLRYYEKRGLIPDPRPRGQGYRDYGESHVRRVEFIKEAKSLGFTLGEIQDLLRLYDEGETTCGDLRTHAQSKLAALDAEIERLSAHRRALNELIERCSQIDSALTCEITDALDPSCCPTEAP